MVKKVLALSWIHADCWGEREVVKQNDFFFCQQTIWKNDLSFFSPLLLFFFFFKNRAGFGCSCLLVN